MFAHRAYVSQRQSYKLIFALLVCVCALGVPAQANKRRAPAGGQRAIVVDERLAALRAEPSLTAPLVQRLGRGRLVAVMGAPRVRDGISFYRVAVTSRTRGWLQADSLVTSLRAHDDARLLRLIQASDDFERIARARIFLDEFPRSPLRPTVLLLMGTEAEAAATQLSRDAARRLPETKLPTDGAPLHSYLLNYNGLDRFNRVGVGFVLDHATKRFQYDGEAWRELVRRYPHSPEAEQARARLRTVAVR